MTYPTAIKDEIGLIGQCLEFGLETALIAVENLPIEALMHPGCRDAMKCIEELATQGREINTYTLSLKWKEMFGALPPEDILNATAEAISPQLIHYNITGITEAWRKRRLMEVCSRVLERAEHLNADDLLAEAEKMLRPEERRAANVIQGKEFAQVLCDDLERRHALNGALSGVPTPFSRLNLLTDGLQYHEQTIIGARPSQGKTSLGLTLIAHACFNHEIPSMIFSFEMWTAPIGRRMLSAWSSMPLSDIRRGTYTEGNFVTFTNFCSFLNKKPFFYVDAKGMGIRQLCATARRYCKRNGVKFILIDFITRIRSEQRNEKRTYEVAEVATDLQTMAQDTGCALLTLAQLNRESEKGTPRPPRLADLADSKSIEDAGDTIALLYRPDRNEKPEEALLTIAKQRDGDLGVIDLHFNTRLCRFEQPALPV